MPRLRGGRELKLTGDDRPGPRRDARLRFSTSGRADQAAFVSPEDGRSVTYAQARHAHRDPHRPARRSPASPRGTGSRLPCPTAPSSSSCCSPSRRSGPPPHRSTRRTPKTSSPFTSRTSHRESSCSPRTHQSPSVPRPRRRRLSSAWHSQTTADHRGSCTEQVRSSADPRSEVGEPDDVAIVLHTSGTTSRPKQVPLRQRNLMASTRTIAAHYELGPEDVSFCVMPLFHVHGLVASTFAALASWWDGDRAAPVHAAAASGTRRERWRATWFSAGADAAPDDPRQRRRRRRAALRSASCAPAAPPCRRP